MIGLCYFVRCVHTLGGSGKWVAPSLDVEVINRANVLTVLARAFEVRKITASPFRALYTLPTPTNGSDAALVR
jgi:hypothetical protein